jgi:hypothetical protein
MKNIFFKNHVLRIKLFQNVFLTKHDKLISSETDAKSSLHNSIILTNSSCGISLKKKNSYMEKNLSSIPT